MCKALGRPAETMFLVCPLFWTETMVKGLAELPRKDGSQASKWRNQ